MSALVARNGLATKNEERRRRELRHEAWDERREHEIWERRLREDAQRDWEREHGPYRR